MALVRYETNPIASLLDELGTVWGDGFTRSGRELFNATYPKVDIVETEAGYTITADLPGVNRDDIKVHVENSVLTISGEKKTGVETREKNTYYHFEREYGKFSRSFSLPEHVDSAHIDARYLNGVLEITLKKTEEAKPRLIEVNVK